MKRIAASLLVVMFAVSLGACEYYVGTSEFASTSQTSNHITDDTGNDRFEFEAASSEEDTYSYENDTEFSQKQDTSSKQQTISRTVYRTPTGKRYHYKSTCGGKNSRAVSLEDAKEAGLTPCQKCEK